MPTPGGAAAPRYHAGMNRPLHALACAAALAAPLAARAAPGCTALSASGVAFGSYDPLASTPLDAAGSISWNCNGVGSVLVLLSAGASGSAADRALVSGADRLAYNLYVDPARTVVWGDFTGGTPNLLPGGNGRQTTPVYGRIPAHQDVRAGTYGDTVVATFYF